jgi:translation initiation factor 2 subunit 2
MSHGETEDYNKLLKRAYGKLPEKTEAFERFEVPEADVLVQGNRTILKNFDSIVSKLRREAKHIAKYLSKELAAPSIIEGSRLILNAKLHDRNINEKLRDYVNMYVICKQCKRPDTKIVEVDRLPVMICEACGARSAVGKL